MSRPAFSHRGGGRRRIAMLVAAGCVLVAARGRAEPDQEAARVVIVANAAQPESLELARFYANKRSIPEENIVALSMPAEETIGWDAFVEKIFNPLTQALVEKEWIQIMAGKGTDEAGRLRRSVLAQRISYLVVCRGVPLRIAHDPKRMTARARERVPARLRTNQASVDGELALLAAPLPDINGPAKNPLYRNEDPLPTERELIVRVARLDGPSLQAAKGLVTSALVAERDGLAGRAYIDLGGPHAEGDVWLRAAADELRELDFDVQVDEAPAVMAATDRCDAPAWYLGWYAGNLTGPFALRGFRFPPGAIALHIHSFSAETVRSETRGWVGPLVARGVAATVGNVFEPMLQLTHHPELLVRALAAGHSWGEAAYYALPALSWQAVLIGDPLYRPMACDLEEQVAKLEGRRDSLSGYVILREANRLARAGGVAEADRWLRQQRRDHACWALALRSAQDDLAAGDEAAARETLAGLPPDLAVRTDEIAVAASVADLRSRLGDDARAELLYGRLLDLPDLDPRWREQLARAAPAPAGH